jgi:polysaccharide export outer membrane protein
VDFVGSQPAHIGGALPGEGRQLVAFVRTAILVLVLVGQSMIIAPVLKAQPAPSVEVYVLGPGDTIDVVIYGEADLSRSVTVKPDGTVSLALLGEVKAAGKTTKQFSDELVRLYKKYLKQPSISVTVREFRVERIYILGQVSRPGEYQLRPATGVMELLASAGGPTNRADLAKVVVIRGKTEAMQLNLLEAFVANRNPDVKLLAGDVLFIPETDRRTVILGQVNRPGAYELLQGQRVSDLIAAAGGVTPRAAPDKAFVVRGQEQIPVDLQKVLAGDVPANLALLPGDMMVVPESQNRIAVMGAVRNPGTFNLVQDMKLVDAIALAGGTTDRAAVTQVMIVRVEGGKPKPITANLERALRGQDITQNLALQTGDVIFVPERGFSLGQIAQWLNLANLSRILFGALF